MKIWLKTVSMIYNKCKPMTLAPHASAGNQSENTERHDVECLIKKTQGQGIINTAFIERLNATFRQRINPLTRRTRTLAQRAETLMAGMYIVGCFYNFCDFHHSLRLKLSVGSFGHHWVQRTPAIASGLTDHQWTPAELLNFKVPLPRWELPIQRGRPSTAMLQLTQQWAN
jgi:hypothetical protein